MPTIQDVWHDVSPVHHHITNLDVTLIDIVIDVTAYSTVDTLYVCLLLLSPLY